MHTNNSMYAVQNAAGNDELGFQPLSILLTNPFTHETRYEVVKHVNDESFLAFWRHYVDHYMNQYDKRFGLFRPEKFDCFCEYDTWEEFAQNWTEYEGSSIIMHNPVLLFDHMPNLEYWTRRQTHQKVLPYQRLVVTTYYISENKFFDFIVKNISDEKLDNIRMLMKSRVGLNLEELFTPARKVAND